jgi:hypothetical protein
MMPHEDAIERGSTTKGEAPPQGGPPALAALSQMELQGAFESAATLAIALRHSPEGAVDVAIAALGRVKVAAAGDADQTPIIERVLAAVRAVVHEGEAAGDGGAPGGDDARAQAERDLEELAARVAGHPLAPAVLRCRVEGVDGAAEIATVLGASADDVHAAHKLLRHHLSQMRAREDEAAPEGAAEWTP